MRLIRKALNFLAIALLLAVYPTQTVYAAFTMVTCDVNTGAVTNGSLFDAQQISDQATCGKITVKNLFSGIACNYFTIINEIFTKFYCALQIGMMDIITASIVIFIAIYGARLMMGMQKTNSGAGIAALIKIGFICLFTTQGAMGVGLILGFFFGLIIQTVSWAVNAIQCKTLICPTAFNEGETIAGIFKGVDDKLDAVITGVNTGTSSIAGLFANEAVFIALLFALLLIAWPIFFLAWSLITTTVMLFIRSLVTFMLSITAIAFLVAISPIFLSFMLFDSTKILFDNWLNFLVSYSLQPLIIFSVFSLWLMVCSDFVGFAGQLSNVMTIIPNNTKDKASVLTKTDMLMFCPFTRAAPPPSGFTAADFAGIIPQVDVIVSILNTSGPGIGCVGGGSAKDLAALRDKTWDDPSLGPKIELVEPNVALHSPILIEFLVYNFLEIIVIGYTFLQLIKMTPQITRAMSKSQAVAPLGFGFDGSASNYLRRATSRGRDTVSKFTDKPIDDITANLKKMTTTRAR